MCPILFTSLDTDIKYVSNTFKIQQRAIIYQLSPNTVITFFLPGPRRNIREPRRRDAHAMHELSRPHLLAAHERGVARHARDLLRHQHARGAPSGNTGNY